MLIAELTIAEAVLIGLLCVAIAMVFVAKAVLAVVKFLSKGNGQ